MVPRKMGKVGKKSVKDSTKVNARLAFPTTTITIVWSLNVENSAMGCTYADYAIPKKLLTITRM